MRVKMLTTVGEYKEGLLYNVSDNQARLWMNEKSADVLDEFSTTPGIEEVEAEEETQFIETEIQTKEAGDANGDKGNNTSSSGTTESSGGKTTS